MHHCSPSCHLPPAAGGSVFFDGPGAAEIGALAGGVARPVCAVSRRDRDEAGPGGRDRINRVVGIGVVGAQLAPAGGCARSIHFNCDVRVIFCCKAIKNMFQDKLFKEFDLSYTIIIAATENNYLHLMVCFVR